MENKPVKIPLGGIERNTPDAICPDGSFDEVLNLRYKDDGYQPIGQSTFIHNCGDTNQVFIHKNAGYEHWLRISNGKLQWFAQKDDSGNIEDIPTAQDIYSGSITGIEFIGNIICILTQDQILYCIWRGEEYSFLGTIPEIPPVTFQTKEQSVEFNVTQSEYEDDYALYPTYTKALGVGRESGYIDGITLIRYAIKMYDGTYIHHSPITLLQPEAYTKYLGGNWGSYSKDASLNKMSFGSGIYYAGALFYELVAVNPFSFPPLDEWEEALDKWEGLIEGIEIFISKNIAYYKSETDILSPDRIKYVRKTTTELIDEIKTESTFYKVYSLDYRDLLNKTFTHTGANGYEDESTGVISYPEETFAGVVLDIKKVLPLLEQQKILPDDTNSHDNIFAKASFIYNSKFHIGNVSTKKFEGFAIGYHQRLSKRNRAPNDPFYILNYAYMICRINIEGQLISVYKNGGNLPRGIIDAFIMYPDYNAYEIEFITFNGNDVISTVFSLESASNLNMASFIDPDLRILEFDGKIIDSVDQFKIEDYVKVSDNIDKGNILKVSQVNNPFLFIAENTYVCGNGDIIGISSLVGDVSSGTPYGTFPLYVFCSDGIKLLETSTGEVYYTRVSEGSRDVCNNKDSIIPIDSGVVFATDRGLMLTNGPSTTEISTQVEGMITDITQFTELLAGITPDLMPSEYRGQFTNLSDGISKVTFLEALKTAKIGYSYKENELYVFADKFSYVYNFPTGLWHKCYDGRIVDNYLSNYPYLYALKGGMMYNVSSEETTSVDCLLFTRPVKLGTEDFKKATRTVLRANFLSGKYLRLLIYGSEDGKTWYRIGGTDRKGNMKDIGSILYRYRAKFFRFAFMGNIEMSSRLNYFEISAETKLDNKLR